MTSSLTYLPEWQALQKHHQEIADIHMRNLFRDDPKRFTRFSLNATDLFLDYSKNRITTTTMELLKQLAGAVKLDQHIEALLSGKAVNYSEQRPALHTALRNPHKQAILVHGCDVMPDIHANLERMTAFAEQVRTGLWHGYNDQPITDIVNIGIGGSYLGPAMATEALNAYADTALRIHFISNIDGNLIQQTLKKLNPATTLFIISSKSFSTIETLTNAQTIKTWFKQQTGNTVDLTQHFVAITEKIDKAIEFGIPATNIFPVWEWVGGRYSLWSASGLPIMLAIGAKNFYALLAGAHAMDEHFRTAAFAENMPVILGLLDVWYNNFFAAPSRAILPYDQSLKYLPPYLQQVHMESLGKHITQQGNAIHYATGQIIFGEVGIDGQHSFYQLLHQGTELIPVDLIIPMLNHHSLDEHHKILLASAYAQSKTLMEGKNIDSVMAELHAAGYSEEKAHELAPHKVLLGNRPSNVILLPQLAPYALGALLALYEHKIFVSSVIWQINAFDQWGVETGKELAKKILPQLEDEKNILQEDSSTAGLIQYYHNIRKS